MRKLTTQSENANAIVEAMRKYNFYATDADTEDGSNIFELMGFTCTYTDISFIFQNEGGNITDTVTINNDMYKAISLSELIDVFLGTLRENFLIPTPRIEDAPIEKYLTPRQKEAVILGDDEDATSSDTSLDATAEELLARLRTLWD